MAKYELGELGIKHIKLCFDDKVHECTCTDYVLEVNGNTYKHRSLLRSLGFQYWNQKAHEWLANIESQEQLDETLKALEGTGIKVLDLRPVYRITDTDTNPVGR